MQHRDDGAADPIDQFETWFSARGWTHERLGDDEIVASTRGAWAQYELRGICREGDGVVQFLAFPDLAVPAEKAASVHEAIGLINEQLWLGHFEYWTSSGALLFRHAAMLSDGEEGAGLTLGQTEVLIETAIEEIDRFYPVFQFVLWGGKSPRDALSAAMVETRGEA